MLCPPLHTQYISPLFFQGYPELGLSPPGHLEVDVWISFEEFKTGISELFFFNDKKPSGAPAENEGKNVRS